MVIWVSLPKRKQNRLDGYSYSKDGTYFITICVENGKTDNKNSTVAKFVSTFKRFCNKDSGENIWQSRYYDHIIRNQTDFDEKIKYIENNPQSWVLKRKPQG